MVVKSKICELEEDIREGFSIRTRKELTGVVQIVSDNNRFLVRFQYRCKNNMSSNQIAIVILQRILEDKEHEVFALPEIPEEQA